MREFVYYSAGAVTAGNLIGDDLKKAGRTFAQSLCDWGAHASHGWLALKSRVTQCFALGGSASLETWPFVHGGFL